MKKGVDLEYAYAEDTMPRGVLGLNATMFKEYLRFIANRRRHRAQLLDQREIPVETLTTISLPCSESEATRSKGTRGRWNQCGRASQRPGREGVPRSSHKHSARSGRCDRDCS